MRKKVQMEYEMRTELNIVNDAVRDLALLGNYEH